MSFVSGFSALVDEVAWQGALAVLLGSDGPAAAAVLAIFLGGLAAGYALFGAHSRRIGDRRRLLRLQAAVEAGIGAWLLAFPALFGLARAASLALPDPDPAGFVLDLLLATLLLGPPALLMGATLPLLTQALARDLPDATRVHALVYATNAGGGFLGALAAGFVLLPGLGIPGSLRAMGVVNLVLALGFRGLAGRLPARLAGPPVAPPAAPPRPPLRVHGPAALLLGFAIIALQTVVIRVGGLAVGASDLTFAVVVSAFVLCLALGSLAVAGFPRLPRWTAALGPALVALLLAALYPALPYAPYGAYRLRVAIGSDPGAFLRFALAASGLTLAVAIVPLGLSGASLPVLFHVLRRRMDDLGGVVGRLYAWNTVGSVLGAVLGGHVLLRWLDLHHVYRLAVGSLVAAATLLALRETRLPRSLVTGLALAAWAWLAGQPAWDPVQLSPGLLRQREARAEGDAGPAAMAAAHHADVRFADDDPTTTVLVQDHATPDGAGSRALLTQGKSDGSLRPDYPTMALTGLVPCLLAEACQRAFVIGLGTGVTAGELASVAGMERVTVAEISPAVVAALPLFDHGNQGASTSPRIEIVTGDALRTLLRRPGPFDVIASEPSHPWASGVERLYALEFLRAARARLSPGGVYAQWMHAYEMDDETLALVLRTFADAFGGVAVWWAQGPDLLLLGFAGAPAPLDVRAVAERARRPDLRAGLARAGVASPAALFAHELLPPGVLGPDTLPGPRHTLLHPRLARRAVRAFFYGERARLARLVPAAARERGARTSALARLAPRDDATFEAIVRETCGSRAFECVTLLGWWRHERPGSPAPERVRASLAEDLEPQLVPARVDALASLFGTGLPGLGPVDLDRLTDHFLAYYHPARPFRREALERSWEACRGAGCAAARRAARARIDGTPEPETGARDARDGTLGDPGPGPDEGEAP